jgi:hypothetical protein
MFSTISKKGTIFEKNVVEHKMCFDFVYKFVHVVPSNTLGKPAYHPQQDIIPYVVKNLSLALLKIGESLPETC